MNVKTVQTQNIDNLFNGILTLKNIDECYAFFCDLLSPRELEMLSQRFLIAEEFYNGSCFTDVDIKTRASSATISKVKKDLVYGNGGLTLVLDRLYNKEVDYED
nr:MAG TPA: putative Trp repressor DNA-binding Trp repressor, TrpR.6A [Caudoviricetes sp.]